MSDSTAPTSSSALPSSRLKETALYFIKLGIFGFGGPLAMVASMQKDLVEKRGWIESDEFSRAFAMIKAMPGPVAFQTAVYLGRRRAGAWGGTAAAFGVVFPAFVLMILFGAFLESFANLKGVVQFLDGMQAAALGLILASVKGLFWPYRKKPLFWILAALAAAITAAKPASEPLVIIAFGLSMAILFEARTRLMEFALPTFLFGAATSMAVNASGSWNSALKELFLASFKAGALVFGSGIAIVPLMEHDFVNRLGWLTHAEFMNALAFGQVTPGPVVITATFIGFKTLGLVGAVAATAGVFAAPFFHMMTWFPPLLGKISKLRWITPFLTGAIAAVVGAILATSIRLATPWAHDPLELALIVGALVAALSGKLPAWATIPLGGLIALAARLVF